MDEFSAATLIVKQVVVELAVNIAKQSTKMVVVEPILMLMAESPHFEECVQQD